MPDLKQAIASGISHCDDVGIEVPLDLRLRAHAVGAVKDAGDISSINAQYHDAITSALTDYFNGGSSTGPRNAFRKATVEALGSAFDSGWTDGGQDLPADEDALTWFNARIQQEIGFIDQLFEQAKELRDEENSDYFTWITARADGYTAAVSECYNTGLMYANKNQMLTWHLGDTEKHCATCSQLNDQSHRASWYLSRNYVPRKPGAGMDCGGYHCDCSLVDKNGNEFTI